MTVIVSLVVPADIVMIVKRTLQTVQTVSGQRSLSWSASSVIKKINSTNTGEVFKTATTQRSTSSLRLNQAFSFIKAQVTLRDKINYYTVRLSEKFSS